MLQECLTLSTGVLILDPCKNSPFSDILLVIERVRVEMMFSLSWGSAGLDCHWFFQHPRELSFPHSAPSLMPHLVLASFCFISFMVIFKIYAVIGKLPDKVMSLPLLT